MTNSYKKEYPFVGYAGFGGGAGALSYKSASSKKYVDDVFSTYLYVGSNEARDITNGIDLSSGGMVWIKQRDDTARTHSVWDTERGVNKYLETQATTVEQDTLNSSYGLKTFNSDGFTLGLNDSSYTNALDTSIASWAFKEQEGFFDVVTYTGTGSARTIAHNLGCVPGCIIIKCTSNADTWFTYHRSLGATKYLGLNLDWPETSSSLYFNDTEPTSSVFSVGTEVGVNGSSKTYVAYLFAGGLSTAATARSVDFDKSGDYLNTTSSSSDFTMGTGDFTVECWVNIDDVSSINGFWQISPTSGGFDSNYGDTLAVAWDHQSGEGWQIYGAGTYSKSGLNVSHPSNNEWIHTAYVRSSGTSTLYIDGTAVITKADTHDYDGTYICIGGYYSTGYLMGGKISNLRVVKGTAVYTSAFKPPTEPLTNITNTKLLCCNNSSTTGSTVSPVTLNSNGDPSASTDSPFDDPDGFKFGADSDNLEGIIKTGSYVGNSTVNHEIYLGWEPQYWLVKNTTGTQNWQLLDSMRGWIFDANDEYLVPNNNTTEGTFNFGNPTPTGFNLSNASSNWQNESGSTYVYIAIRRPDGVVGKPPSAGTDAFAMDTGNSSGTIPNYDSTFPVDFAWSKKYSGSGGWYTGARLTGSQYLQTNSTNPGADAGATNWTWDSNVGWQSDAGYDSTNISHMWKRGAGFDVVAYESPGGNSFAVNHSLGVVPEMMWFKRTTDDGGYYNWTVYHKGLNGGTNPEQYGLHLNSDVAEVDDYGFFADIAPNATTFQVGYDGTTGSSGKEYVAMLFASVEGISKVGSYSGTGSQLTVTTGFQPRFIIIKSTSGSRNWLVFDTLRGWAAGNDAELNLNTDAAQNSSYDFGAPTATGFTAEAVNADINASGHNYIYYAHA